MLMEITSLNNPKVTFWNKLKGKKYRDETGLFIVESKHLVNEALKKGKVSEIVTTEKVAYPVPTYYVSAKVMQKISSLQSPSPVLAICKHEMTDTITGNVLILDNIQDPGNLGTIIRSAVAFHFETLIISHNSVDIYNEKVIRSSEGMFFNLNIIRTNLLHIIPRLKKEGYLVIGTDVNKAQPIQNFKNQKCAYIIGNEGQGISNEVKGLCDNFIKIPMEMTCESLNAAVASSIIMYEVYHE